MIRTIIKKGSYQDSVVLMLLTNKITSMPGVRKVSVMMATPANKEMYVNSGLAAEELMTAGSNDMAIVADVESDTVMDDVLREAEQFLKEQSTGNGAMERENTAKNWEQARSLMPDANLALISIPGMYAAREARRAVNENMHVFLFSDNVPLEDEVRLKQMAHEKGLLIMGPDCGTAVLSGIPVAFSNQIRRGRIGIAGASGTGIQELISVISRNHEGISHAIGTGGRDLLEEAGGITMLDAIDALEADDDTKVLIVVSKPPAPAVRQKIVERLQNGPKPAVALFSGEKPEHREDGASGIYQAYTLEEAALAAVGLLIGIGSAPEFCHITSDSSFTADDGRKIKGYYSGGTLAAEAAMLLSDSLGLRDDGHKEGCKLDSEGHVILDLGDDIYTRGTPHPMIAPEKRVEWLWSALDDPHTGVILFDVVLGYGSCQDMAGALCGCLADIRRQCEAQGRTLYMVADLCGTEDDIQGYAGQKALLEDAGVIVCSSNRQSVLTALALIGHPWKEEELFSVPRGYGDVVKDGREMDACKEGKCPRPHTPLLAPIKKLLSEKPRVINIGLKSFGETLSGAGCQVVQFNWEPPAGGKPELIRALDILQASQAVSEANQKVTDLIMEASPVLIGVTPAMESIPQLREGKTLLHAGPPIIWENMPGPMQGSCIGALLFEEWAVDEADARCRLETGQIRFIPCHHVGAVGPMGGITSPHMPVFKIRCQPGGNLAYCTMNEGIGRVLRFGAYSQEVIDRLRWMRDVLGPVLGRALRVMDGGLAVNPMIAKAIAMGDEFHQRNIAASLIFLKETGPLIAAIEEKEKAAQVISFLARTDQFFLNIMMASAKAVMDYARTIKAGTIVTAMCRNGENFGIRISGMGDQWFTAPVNTPQGLYFTGFTGEDASPDMGDSAITETFGVGGMAMIAAPAVTRFVGAGGFYDAVQTSSRMAEICLGHNSNFPIPTWDFQGACLGIDACKVVENGITPVINTGIAHREAGKGQIGAGTVSPPMECFEKAVLAYAETIW